MTHFNTKQPNYCSSKEKYFARELHIDHLYPLFTGNSVVPENRQYYFLSNIQDKSEGSEVSQLIKPRPKGRFISLQNIYGIDIDSKIIKKNKRNWGQANWISDEWTKAITKESCKENFNPAIVYLDTTYFVDSKKTTEEKVEYKYPALRALETTLKVCRNLENVLVIANFMMANPRSGKGEDQFSANSIIDNLILSDHPNTYSEWNISQSDKDVSVFHSYEYRTRKTPMRSYIFFKGMLPKEGMVIKTFSNFSDWCVHSCDQLILS
jgi:hypothetical protein